MVLGAHTALVVCHWGLVIPALFASQSEQDSSERMLKTPFSPRLLKKVQMQGAARRAE
jgi:hypothetical protein